MAYVDGFVIPLAVDNLEEYRKMAELAGKVWMEHGALDFKECKLEDSTTMEESTPFTKLAGVQKNETVLFSFIVFKSRQHRDEVNAKVMQDARLKDSFENMPFDCKRMAYGGFDVMVDMSKETALAAR